jgi:hypothetical protein
LPAMAIFSFCCNEVDGAWWRPASTVRSRCPNSCVLWSVRPCQSQNETIFSPARLNAALIGARSRAPTFSYAAPDPTRASALLCADSPPAGGWCTDVKV